MMADEATPTPSNAAGSLVLHNKYCVKKIFSFLSRDEVKRCKMVCSFWNYCSKPGNEPEMFLYMNGLSMSDCFGDHCASFLPLLRSSHTTQLNLAMVSYNSSRITSLALELVSSANMQKFALSSIIQEMTGIKELHLVRCVFNCTGTFVKLLSRMPMLESLNLHSSIIENVTSSDGDADAIVVPNLRKVKLEVNCTKNVPYFMLLSTLNAVLGMNCSLKEFTLKFNEPDIDSNARNKEIFRQLWNFRDSMIQFLDKRSKTLEKIVILLPDFSRSSFIDDGSLLLFATRLWAIAAEMKLDELTINALNIADWGYGDNLIPSAIARLKFLRKVTIIDIRIPTERLEEELGFIITLKQNGCEVNLTVLDSSYCMPSRVLHGIPEEYNDIITAINLKYKLAYGTEFPSNAVTFPQLSEFSFSVSSNVILKSWFYKDLFYFCTTFGNLKILNISVCKSSRRPLFDRPRWFIFDTLTINYSTHEYPSIGDEEFQWVIQSLTQLEILIINADMSEVTDNGLTGGSSHGNRPMSSLNKLKEVSLIGLGPKITDKSLRLGFNGMPFLDKLKLKGNIKICKRSVERFKSTYGGQITTDIDSIWGFFHIHRHQ